MIEKICEICGKPFKVIKCREYTAKYCSIKCRSISLKAENNLVCPICGKSFHLKNYRISKSKNNFCSRECLNLWKQENYKNENNPNFGKKGPLNSLYKGDEIQYKNSYQLDDMIYCPNHPRATKAGRVRKYIILVEENYMLFDSKYFYFDGEKHYLKKGVVIHHIDQNHNNNNIQNLMPLTISEHIKIHQQLGTYSTLNRDELGKFKSAVLKQGELLETPEVDNQQPSLSSNTFEGSTTNSRVQTGNTEDSNADTSALPIVKDSEDIV